MKHIITIVCVIFSIQLWGQPVPKLLQIADQHYESGRYAEAVEYYDKVLSINKTNNDARYKQAVSYFKMTMYNKAGEAFSQLSLQPSPYQAQSMYYNGFVLKTMGKFESADSAFSTIEQLNGPIPSELSELVKLQKEGCRLGMRLQRLQLKYQVEQDERINSSFNDFGAVEWPKDNRLVISSTRKIHSHQYADPGFGGFMPGFMVFQKENQKWGETSTLADLNFRWSQATGSFTADGQWFYFTRCGKASPCHIYASYFDNDKGWTEPAALDSTINVPLFQSKQPYITAGGDTLFFSSDRPGGKGNLDIWMSLKINPGEWTYPINLGESINTFADEITPFFSNNFNCLMFSSNGHAGYGGFDLYLAKGVSFFEPKIYNLGPPFNSNLDDTYPFLGTKGYLSSNRDGDFDVFEFDFDTQKRFFRDILSQDAVLDVQHYNSVTLDLNAFRTDDYQKYHMFLPGHKTPAAAIDKKGYNLMNISGINAAKNSVVRMLIGKETEWIALAEENGNFTFMICPDSLSGKYTISTPSVNQPVVQEKDTTGMFFRYSYEKIFFDYDKSSLRKESMESLNDLLNQFDRDNIVLIDIQTHSDGHGKEDYNKRLSENRGMAVMRYLKARGIPEHKMRGIAFGERQLVTAKDSWFARFFSRRAEIIVYTQSPVTYNVPEVYLVMRDLPLNTLAQYLKIGPDKLKKWNGLTSDMVSEGSTLRIYGAIHAAPGMRNLISQKDLDYNLIPHIVQSGETIESISRKFNTIEELIIEINNLTEEVKEGDEIVILKLESL